MVGGTYHLFHPPRHPRTAPLVRRKNRLEVDPDAKPRQERIHAVGRAPEAGPKNRAFRHDGLAVGHIEQVDQRLDAEPVANRKLAREPQIQEIHARITQNSSRLGDDRLRTLVESYAGTRSADSAEDLRRLNGKAGVMLEVDARTEFPR